MKFVQIVNFDENSLHGHPFHEMRAFTMWMQRMSFLFDFRLMQKLLMILYKYP